MGRHWGLLVALLVATSAGAATLDERGRDVFDRPVAELVSRGLPTLVLYANKGTKDAIQGPATEMAVRLHDVSFVTVVHVDLREVPSFFRGIARGKIRNSQQDAAARYADAYRQRGYPVPADFSDRLIFVADSDGAPHQAIGLGRGFNEAQAAVFDAQGREVFRGSFPRAVGQFEQAIRDAAARGKAALR